jgi:cytoskeleton protein RodZ
VGELGELLRESRQQIGLTLEDVRESTRINVAYLGALEEEDFDALPHACVARGFLRSYAQALNLDPEYVVDLAAGTTGQGAKGRARSAADPFRYKDISMAPPSRWTADLAVGFLILVLVAAMLVGGLYVYGDRAMDWAAELVSTPVVPTEDLAFILPTPTPLPTFTATPTATATPEYYAGVTVELVIADDSWVQVLVDGDKAYEGILKEGEQRHWSGERQVAVRVGNAGGVEAIINGQSIGVLGEPGQVVDQMWEMLPEGAVATQTPAPEVTAESEAEAQAP